jgi:type IV fimbrial biogenesis protein FimT
MPRRRAARGFTLIELMSVAAIAAILIAVGAPPLGEFMADQRVRSTASDFAAEIAFARAKAIENSRRAYIERTGGEWRNGWRVYVDLNNSGGFDAGEELKRFEGFAPTGTLYVCSTVADFGAHLIFRPDGRVVRSAGRHPCQRRHLCRRYLGGRACQKQNSRAAIRPVGTRDGSEIERNDASVLKRGFIDRGLVTLVILMFGLLGIAGLMAKASALRSKPFSASSACACQ